MKSFNLGVFAILGLFLAAAGILAPIIWDLYKTTSALELHHVSNIKLVESVDLPEKLQLTYDGRPVPTLSRHTFSLINTGRKPILKNALILPPTIAFQGNVDILEVIEDATSPQDLDVTYTVQKTDNTVAVSFSLLNPGDQTQFGILLSGFTSEYTARARIVGIQKLKVIERVVEFREVKGKTPVTVYVVGFFVLFLLAGIIGGIIEIIEDYKIREAIASDTFDLPKGKPKEDYIEFLRYTFTHKIEKELRPLTSFIEGMPSNVPLDEEQYDEIRQRVKEFAKKHHQILPITIIMGCLSLLGFWYVLSRIP